MSDEGGWWTLLRPVIPFSSIPPAILFYQWWATRADRRIEAQRKTDLTVLQRREEAMAVERKALTDDQRELLERAEGERDRAMAARDLERGRRIELERDRDRGWYLARYYYASARDAVHSATNARGRAEALYRLGGQTDAMVWSALPTVPPHLEDVE